MVQIADIFLGFFYFAIRSKEHQKGILCWLSVGRTNTSIQ